MILITYINWYFYVAEHKVIFSFRLVKLTNGDYEIVMK